MLKDIHEGFRYAFGFGPVRSSLLLLAASSLFGMPYSVLMPAMASTVFHGGPHTLGFLMTASGAGAVVGALYLASRRSVLGLGRVMVMSTLAFGAALIVFGSSRALWLALLALPFAGAGFMVEMASTNTILQTITEEHLRGRVMAFYTLAFLGTAPIGSLLAGVVADRIGPPATIVAGGFVCVAGGVWLALRLPSLRQHVRPIYVERGILPGLPSGGSD